MCGEKAPFLAGAHIYHGSPPRVRGKVYSKGVGQIYSGITPACAGKREKGLWRFCEYKDHPRVCGEKRCLFLLGEHLLGSPPRVRGKVKKGEKRYIISRITPACAGKSPG